MGNRSYLCIFMVTNTSLQTSPFPTFDPSILSGANAPTFSFTQIPLTGGVGAPAAVSVSATVPASPLANTLFVNSIGLTNFVCASPPCNGLTNRFNANLTVGFSPSSLVMPLQSLQFPVILTTSGWTANSPAANHQTAAASVGA